MNTLRIMGLIAVLAGPLAGCQIDQQFDESNVHSPSSAVQSSSLHLARASTPTVSSPVSTSALTPVVANVDLHFADAHLGWGSGDGQVGLIPFAPERPPMGPMSVAVGPDAKVWLLDQVNRRVVALSPTGDWLDELPAPPGAIDLAVDPAGRPAVLSIINHMVTFVDDDQPVEEIAVPMGIRLVGGIEFEANGDLLLENGYQQTFTLTLSGAPIAWPNLLHTQRDGTRRGSSGAPRQVVLRDGAAVVLTPVPGSREAAELILEGTDGAASVALVSTLVDGGAIVLLEWFEGDGVIRTMQRFNANGQLVATETLPRSPLYYPFREFAVAGDGTVLHLYPTDEGLLIHTIRLSGQEVPR